jgi:mitochondrial fission protein ELM1
VWAVTDGRAGIENQALGLAEAVARRIPSEISVKRVDWPRWMRRTPSRFIPALPRLLASGGDGMVPPWPDLWIGNGRAAIPLSIAVRRWSRHTTFVVQLQDPLRPSRLFDLTIPPTHDPLRGPDVFPIIGAPHRVTPDRLAEAYKAFAPLVEPLPRPRMAVLIGGTARAYGLGPDRARQMATEIADAVTSSGGSLMLTFSRRTPPQARAILTERLSGLPGIIWDETGPNPYFAFLAAADAVMVTEDSANMPAEAAATGAPVHLLKMDGGQPRRRRFHADLAARGVLQSLRSKDGEGSPPRPQRYDPLRETDRAAEEVLRRMRLAGHIPATPQA